MSKVLGYNFVFKFNGKRIAGVTQDDIDIAPITKESITKDDNGVTQVEVVGHTIDISVSGMIDLDASDQSKMHADALINLGLATGSGATVPFVYTRSTGQSYTGNAQCTGYSESTNAEDYGTFTIKFRISGTLTAA